MADVYRFRQRKKSRSVITPPAITKALSAFGLYPGNFTHFTINKRRKTSRRERSVEVWLWTEDKHGLNLSSVKNIHLSTEREARDYIKVFATGSGLHLTELISEEKKCPRPGREDAALLRQGIVKEEWLASDVPTLWAEAMVRCQHPAGFCGQDGFCHYGDCKMEMKPVEPHAVEDTE